MTTKLVDTSIICAWLSIPLNEWPPDHYTLLGLPPGEKDDERIERQVQQRLELVRRYQLTNPEPATEAMNRLAQAFVCLSDPQARAAYNQALFGSMQPEPSFSPSVETATAEQVAVDTAADPEFLSLVEEKTQTPAVSTAPVADEKQREPEAPAAEPHRRGLGTRRAIYERIVRTRALMQMWESTGKYLGQSKKRLSRPSEARELIELMTALREGVKQLPVMGEAGQPGYLVVSLARQQAIVPTFQTLLPSQREALARDWIAGQKALREHQKFLRQESRSLRRKSIFGQLVRAGRAFLNENPAGWLIALALLAIVIALVRRQLID
jgi:hypothetical protein